MKEPTALNEPSPVSETNGSQSKIQEFGLPLSRRQTVLLIGLAIVVAVVLWRRRVNRNRSHKREEVRDSETVENGQSEERDSETIYVQHDPDDELEKDAVVLDALRNRGKLGGE
jgi:hypothetical protein